MRRVVILGGGFAGAAAAILLSRLSAEPLALTVVEPRAEPGPGLAHSTPEPDHRLNGPDRIHSLHPDDLGHFADWMRSSGTLAADPAATAASGLVFARRRDFGRYMAAELARHAAANPSGSRIEHVRDTAVRATPGTAGVEVELAGGRRLHAERCVLALGWDAVGVPAPLTAITGHPCWLPDPWDPDRLSAIRPDAPVLLVGAGLTASDTLAALTARGHRGPVLALSRRGLRPASQNPFRPTAPTWDRIVDPDPPYARRNGRPDTIRAALRALRREIAAVDPTSSSWHTPFDALRDSAWTFWPTLADDEKRRFVRHLKSWYDAWRYRNPPQVERIVDDATRDGRLTFAGGRLRDARADGALLAIDVDPRGGGARHTIRAAAVVNCTGPQPRPGASANPLWRAMLADGVARDAPSGLGIDVDAVHRVLDRRGRPQDALLAIGPPTIGRFGEAAAVPYVVRQILEIAPRIASTAWSPLPQAAPGVAPGGPPGRETGGDAGARPGQSFGPRIRS